MEKNVRRSNIELLRIVAILMVTLHHLALHSGILDSTVMFNRLLGYFFYIGGKIGVNCFVFITGYFLCDRKRKSYKILDLWLQIVFYALVLTAIGIFLKRDLGEIQYIIASFLPVSFKMYWFCTAIIGLYVVSPIINIIIEKVSHKQLGKILLILFFMLVAVTNFTNQEPFYSEFIWFIYMYLIAAYIKQEERDVARNGKLVQPRLLAIFIMIWLLIFGSIVALEILGKYIEFFTEGQYFFASQQSILVLFESIILFIYFLNKKPFVSEKVNWISKHSFGMYLIQSHPLFSSYIYEGIVFIKISDKIEFIGFVLIYVFALFCGATIMDFLQKIVVSLHLKKWFINTKVWRLIDRLLDL